MSYTIAVDAMGGDHAPHEIIKGTVQAIRSDADIEILIVGDKQKIESLLKQEKCQKQVSIIHTDQWIDMHESPKVALKEKPEASINIATRLVHEGAADALVSAGSTGATIISAAKNLNIIRGIERSALAAIYPTATFSTHSKGFSLILDVGATIHCTPKQLVHFAYMGSFYASKLLDVPNPRIALLNIGEEETKGGEVMVKTYRELKEAEGLNFLGNIEGKDIPYGDAHVIITEGFIGNVVLKMMEGMSGLLKQTGQYAVKKKISWKLGMALLYSGVRDIRNRTDYSEYGGAPILGFEKLIIKAHGRSNAKAIRNAIHMAERSIKEDVCAHIAQSIDEFNNRHRIDFLEI
ncbi:MAG: phosphate acyltransferase PlsX [Caldithrix sp.]|nr:phosphate acyltransferase PlsX [Caldithrix sp.]